MHSLPRMRRLIWGHRSPCLPLSAPQAWGWEQLLGLASAALLYYPRHIHTSQSCLAQIQSCCALIVWHKWHALHVYGWAGRWMLGMRCDVFPWMCVCMCVCVFVAFGTTVALEYRKHLNDILLTVPSFKQHMAWAKLEAYMNTTKSSSGSSVTQGWLETLGQHLRELKSFLVICIWMSFLKRRGSHFIHFKDPVK